MAVSVPGLGIPGLAETQGIQFEFSGGGVATNGKGVEGMVTPIPVLDSYLSLFILWAGAVAAAASAAPS